eukprot:403340186
MKSNSRKGFQKSSNIFLQYFLVSAFFLCTSIVNTSDTTTYFQKYTCTSTTNSPTHIAGTLATTPDTKLYLGDSSSTLYRPTISTDYGLFFTGDQLAYTKASSTYTYYSNELRYTGSTVTMWVNIFDGQRDQVLMCKQNRNGATDVADKICFGMKNGYYYAKIYNETLTFDADVQEGWNFIAFMLTMDATSTYSRARVVAYSRSRVIASYKTFSYAYQDDVDYDMVFGGKWANDGLNITNGFSGYILEIRLYSTVLLTMANLDDMIDWDCTANTAQKFCEFCPLYVTATANTCLEDFSTVRTLSNYMAARWQLTGAPTGTARQYYTSTLGTQVYQLYLGNAYPDVRTTSVEPHRSEVNGFYFDGGDYMTTNIDSGTTWLTFSKYFTVEMWVRFTETTMPSQNYYLFQKINSFGTDTPMFQAYFAQGNGSFIVYYNGTYAIEILNAYNKTTFPQSWVFVAVTMGALYYPTDLEYFQSKICAYIWGPNDSQQSSCAVINDYYDETLKRPYKWDTRVGQGLVGFIRNIYFWKTYKPLTHLYYTPRRNYPYKDKCSPFANQGYPVCDQCDQYLGASTCFSSCVTSSYASQYNYCLDRNCTNDLCTSCYYDTDAWNNNYCTGCIPNASIIDGTLGNCACNDGYFQQNSTTITCESCHANCKTCYGLTNSKCYTCKQGKPSWQGKCLDNCGQIGSPYNETYTYSSKENTCVSCYDFYYTTDWLTCTPQPFPKSVTNYNNQYLILRFSSPVKYSGQELTSILTVSISGKNEPYDYSWSAPYWESNQYAKDVFIQLSINSILDGDEKIYIYIDNIYVSDSRGYQLLARNSTSKLEFLPLSANLNSQDYLSASERAIIQGAGTSIIISLMITLAFNALIMFLSSGSMEILWTFLNVLQIINYIPNLKLYFPTSMTMMFSYLSIANSDIQIIADIFSYVFNLNDDTFPDDYALHGNFDKNGYSSMKIVMNLQSQLGIIVAFIYCYCLLILIKNISLRCCKNTPLEIFCSALSLLLVCLTILFPILSCFFLYQYRHKFRAQEDLKHRYGALFEEFKMKKWYQYMHATFFILRRMLFIMCLVFLSSNPMLQLIVFQIINFSQAATYSFLQKVMYDHLLPTWIIIGIVVLMVIINLMFIFPFKIYETCQAFKEKQRLTRLKFISEVEQKYLMFDYKKFFLSTLTLHKSKEPVVPLKKKESLVFIKPTEIYNPSEEDEEPENDIIPMAINPTIDDSDQIPPEPYSNNQPLQIERVITPDQPIYVDTQSLSNDMDPDKIDPNAHTFDRSVVMPGRDSRDLAPGFQWLNDINNGPDQQSDEDMDNTNNDLYSDPAARSDPNFHQNLSNNYPLLRGNSNTLTEPNRGYSPYDQNRKKSVRFNGDLGEQLHNTDGFERLRKPTAKKGGFFDNLMEEDNNRDDNNQAQVYQNSQSEDYFKSDHDINDRDQDDNQLQNRQIWPQKQ